MFQNFFFFFIKAACLLSNPALTSAYLLDLVWTFIILLYFDSLVFLNFPEHLQFLKCFNGSLVIS